MAESSPRSHAQILQRAQEWLEYLRYDGDGRSMTTSSLIRDLVALLALPVDRPHPDGGDPWQEVKRHGSDLDGYMVPMNAGRYYKADAVDRARALADAQHTQQIEALTRQIESIATMLGRMNVPPPHILEGDIAALKARVADSTALRARLRAVETALRAIAEHDGHRGAFTDEDIWQDKPTPQELAAAALASSSAPQEP